jgi:hypothetical protein
MGKGDDGTLFPNLSDEPYPDDLVPEGGVINSFWKDMYWMSEQGRKKCTLSLIQNYFCLILISIFK